MRKENVLVVVLAALAFGGIYLYNRPAPDLGGQMAAAPAVSDVQIPRSASAAVSKDIFWRDYTPGMALAQKERKSVFLYFYAPWCGYCVKLKQETFKDDRVKAYLNEHFVSIGVDTDQRQKLARQWGVRGLPNLWFLESDGTKISNLPGFVGADQLLMILQYIHTQSYKTMNFNEYVQQKKS